MTAKFTITRDINGYPAYGLPLNPDSGVGSVENYNTTLSANVAQNFTIPSSYENWAVVFSFSMGSNVWVANNDTAALPGGSFALSSSQLNPGVRQVKGGDVLSFITADTNAYVGASLYAIS